MATVSIKPAATGNYRHTYNPVTVGSLDFGELVCSRKIEVEKGDDWNSVKCKGTLRLLPQQFPAYGKNTLKSAAFFVPASQIVEYYDQFRNNKTLWKGKPVRLPKIYANDINKMFFDHRAEATPTPSVILCEQAGYGTDFNSVLSTVLSSGKKFHFVYLNSAGTWFLLRLTRAGKYFYKVLKMLGYDFVSYAFDGDWTDISGMISAANFSIDIMDLLAYSKVYVDYFMNANMYNTSPLVAFLQAVHDDESYNANGFNYQNGYIDSNTLFSILMSIQIPFEHNMYLDAFNSPNSPLGVDPSSEMISLNPDGVLSPINPDLGATDPYGNSDRLDSNSQGTFIHSKHVPSSSPSNFINISRLSQLGLNSLGALYQFVRRNNLFGSKPIQEIFARFGIKDSDWNTHFAHKLYEGESEIDYSAVLSQTDNYNSQSDTGKSLGAFAGFGVSGLNFTFDYKSSDHGFLFVLHWVQITPIQIHGMDPSVLRVHPFDFYTPEYDGKTLRAIPYCEVSRSKDAAIGKKDSAIYGFTDIYEEYRHMRDSVFGDFVTDEEGANNFFFGRDLSFFRDGFRADGGHSNPGTNGLLKPQLNYIQYMSRFGTNFDCTNPFQASAANGDRFYLEVKFDISANRHISSKSAALDLNGEGDMQMQLGGTQIQ